MARRPRALSDYYAGLAWKEHSVIANSTIIDSSNVLLLRPAKPNAGFSNAEIEVALVRRRPPTTRGPGLGLISANIVYLRKQTPASFVDYFERNVRPLHEAAGAWVVAKYVSEDSANNFPQFPIRENERVFVWFSRFANQEAFERYQRNLAASRTWHLINGRLSVWTDRPIETLRLIPTARSLLHGYGPRSRNDEQVTQPSSFAYSQRLLWNCESVRPACPRGPVADLVGAPIGICLAPGLPRLGSTACPHSDLGRSSRVIIR